MKKTFTLAHPLSRRRAMDEVANAPEGYVVTVAEPTRNLSQNARLWAMLTDVSEQVQWYGKTMDQTAWKALFTAGLKQMDVVPNLSGTGFVALGQSTSSMSKREFGELIELIQCFGAERNVIFNEPAQEPA